MKLSELPLLHAQRSCLPCAHGAHSVCRGRAESDGSQYEKDPETGEGRWVRRDRVTKEEIPKRRCHCALADHIGEPGTCYRFSSDSWRSWRCGRPAKGEITVREMGVDVTIEVCGLHLAGWRRQEKTREQWRLADEARTAKRNADQAASEASKDWAGRLEDEFGLPVEPVVGDPIRVRAHPEKLYAILSEVRSLLDDVYPDHPFKRS